MAAVRNFRGTCQVNDNPQRTLLLFEVCISPSSVFIWDEFKMFLNKKTG